MFNQDFCSLIVMIGGAKSLTEVIKKGAPINRLYSEINLDKGTLLHVLGCSPCPRKEVVQVLLKRGVDINTKDMKGLTAR